MTKELKSYNFLECNNLDIISTKIYKFIQNKTTLLTDYAEGWQFVDAKSLLLENLELLEFFNNNKLYVNNASVVILYNDLQLHIDELPMVAKVNIPVSNTYGWVNRWYKLGEDEIALLPKTPNQFGSVVEDVSKLSNLILADEIYNLNRPIVFNSRIPHSVIKLTPEKLPRIIASFTFFNQPIYKLK